MPRTPSRPAATGIVNRHRAFAVAMLSGLLATLALCPSALAAVPGVNGKIAFQSNTPYPESDIVVMNADGSGQTNLTNNPAHDGQPAFSPDGQRIAFTRGRSSTRRMRRSTS